MDVVTGGKVTEYSAVAKDTLRSWASFGASWLGTGTAPDSPRPESTEEPDQFYFTKEK
jgi:hypothetical protein